MSGGPHWGRQLFLCKKALKRHRGPEVRAKELQVADIESALWTGRCSARGCYIRPAWMYAMAVLWMLRACEVTELKMGDVHVDYDEKTVSLCIKKSKTDQAAKGTRRTLTCCGRQSCTRECPFALTAMVLADRPNGKVSDYLFATQGRVKTGHAPPDAGRRRWTKISQGIQPGVRGRCTTRDVAWMCRTSRSWDVGEALQSLGIWKRRCRKDP